MSFALNSRQSRSSPDMEVITENRWRDGNDSAGGQLQKKVKKTSARLVKKAKRRKRELKLEAAAEISQAKSKLKSNFRYAIYQVKGIFCYDECQTQSAKKCCMPCHENRLIKTISTIPHNL